MNAASKPRTLPIRRWLALAVLIIFLAPVAVTGVAVFHLAGVGELDDDLDEALELLRDDQASWTDPEWQAATSASLGERDVDFVLMEDGRELYRSAADPFVDGGGDARSRRVEQLVIPGSEPVRSALVYGRDESGPPEGIWIAPIVALSTLFVTLAGIAWFIGRTVVRPLAATSGAARQIATGDLEVSLPSSQMREVAEVSTALELMSRELRNSIEQQAALEEERRLFVAAVAHDLRTPLFSLRGALEGLETGLAGTPEKRAHYVAIAREKADALDRLISDLFDFTRLEYLDQTPRREPFDLAALLRRSVDGLQPQAEAKGVELALSAPSSPCTIQADEHLLTRAVENLLDNALRFTPPGGSVSVECGASGDAMTFSIRDTGPGIPVQDLPHLFSPLYRGETSRHRGAGGAGLGLTIARRILRSHGGGLTAGNHAGGAVFTASLPRSAAIRDRASTM